MLEFPQEHESKAVIKVIGIGRAGVRIINAMIEWGMQGVEFINIHTSVQDLIPFPC